ncbi:hypothetical protein OESDEN_05499 [Oesophagostomum dentatum]|uniref:VWFA domain-containing protein n=1 Tax=Oesophagostomum dentatum TaxID=61180 RepID=A0A0B1TAI9_OESDE|nr:hypothetical protein OESDEN_05499 [Oesophagostomum dentatum]
MTNEGLAQVTANIATVLGPVTIAQGQGQHSRVSIITYGATATIVFNFTDFNSTDEMLNEMFKIECGIDEKANLWE